MGVTRIPVETPKTRTLLPAKGIGVRFGATFPGETACFIRSRKEIRQVYGFRGLLNKALKVGLLGIVAGASTAGWGFGHAKWSLQPDMVESLQPVRNLTQMTETLIKGQKSLATMLPHVQEGWGTMLSHYVQDFYAPGVVKETVPPLALKRELKLSAEDICKIVDGLGEMPDTVSLLNVNDYRQQLLKMSDEVFARHMTEEELAAYKTSINGYFDTVEMHRNTDFGLGVGGLLLLLSSAYGVYKGYKLSWNLDSDGANKVVRELCKKYPVVGAKFNDLGWRLSQVIFRAGRDRESLEEAVRGGMQQWAGAMDNQVLAKQVTNILMDNFKRLETDYQPLRQARPKLFVLGLMDLWFALYTRKLKESENPPDIPLKNG